MVTFPPQSDGMPSSQEVIYILEDDAGARLAVQELVRPLGVRIKAFESAEAFLAAFRHDAPCCLLVNEQLPGMKGSEMYRQLIDSGIHVPAVFAISYPSTPMTVQLMRMGASDVLDKPCNEMLLRQAIERGLAEDRHRLRNHTAQQEMTKRIEELSEGQRDVLVQVLEGVPNKQIARHLGVCIRTIEARRSKIYKALGVKSVAELVRTCVAAGFIPT